MDFYLHNENFITYHHVHYQNNSSHNIIIQYFLNSDWYSYVRPKGNVYFINVDEIPMSSNSTVVFSDAGYKQFTKALIVDTDTRKQLKKIKMGWSSFLNMLKKEMHFEKEQDGRVTTYSYYFIITDDFLNRK